VANSLWAKSKSTNFIKKNGNLQFLIKKKTKYSIIIRPKFQNHIMKSYLRGRLLGCCREREERGEEVRVEIAMVYPWVPWARFILTRIRYATCYSWTLEGASNPMQPINSITQSDHIYNWGKWIKIKNLMVK